MAAMRAPQLRHARRVADGVLRHRARPAGDAGEARRRGDAGDVAQFPGDRVDHGFIGLCQHAGISAPPRKHRATILPSGTRWENFVPDPGQRDQAAALLLRNQEAEARPAASRNPRR